MAADGPKVWSHGAVFGRIFGVAAETGGHVGLRHHDRLGAHRSLKVRNMAYMMTAAAVFFLEHFSAEGDLLRFAARLPERNYGRKDQTIVGGHAHRCPENGPDTGDHN